MTDSIAKRGGLAVVLVVALGMTAFGLWIGPLRFVARGGGPWVEILPLTFGAWEGRPFTDHYLLSFINPDTLASGRAYPNYTQPWLLLQYVLLQPLRWAGVSYVDAQIALCLPHFAVVLLLVVAHFTTVGELPPLRAPSPRQLRLGVIALAVASVLTLPSFWIPFVRFNPEQYCFVPGLAFCHLAAADFQRRIGAPADWLALFAIALFAPVFAPFAIVSWLVLWELGSDADAVPPANVPRLARLGAVAAVAAATFLLPRLILFLTALSGDGSSVYFRTGLDGSSEHFSSMLQAVLAPSYPRPWYLFHWPLVAFATAVAGAAVARDLASRMLRQLFVAWLPYLWALVVFPQWVSVHPYCFDFLLTLGAAFCVAFWLQRPELRAWASHPAMRLAGLIVAFGLLMTNLIDLARLR